MVAPEVASLSFDAALLVSFARRAELCPVLPVRTERDEPRRQFALLAAQNFLNRARQVIVAKHPEDTFVSERQFVRLEKCLLRRTCIRSMKSRAAGHRAHRRRQRASPVRRPDQRRPHTSPPGPRHPSRSSAERTSDAWPDPVHAGVSAHTPAPSARPVYSQEPRRRFDRRSAEPYAAACAVPYGHSRELRALDK